MGLDRDLLIDALMEKTEELRQRERTIQTQNCLLEYAWANAQKLASCQHKSQEALAHLREYVERLLAADEGTDFNANKKRKLRP
jgi:predicted mannosyl-3-phosphoglycerate phosphatase (HAD superfamily)